MLKVGTDEEVDSMAAAGRQLRLLLWKDYLVRKRNFVTLGGVVWATMIMLALYVVRINIDNQDFPNCQYPARALPSAGMLRFVQSFICSVDNQCKPMDQYQEIPAYKNSKLSQVQDKLWPLLSNTTVVEVAGAVPGALKLSATLARVLDDPILLDITRTRDFVFDLRGALSIAGPWALAHSAQFDTHMMTSVAECIFLLQIMKSDMDRCEVNSMSKFIRIENKEYMEAFVNQLCRLDDKDLQRLASNLLLEINFAKYITMAGNMYYKLSGDERVLKLAALVRAATHVTRLDSFLPPVFTALFERRTVDFSYFNVSIMTNLMDQFEPTFGKTQAYKILRDITDTVATALQYLDKIFKADNPVENVANLLLSGVGDINDANELKGQDISNVLTNAIDVFEKAAAKEPIDIFNILTQLTNFISKILSDKTRHDVQFYSTLLAKLIEGANKVVSTNWNIQEMAYDVSLRNPEGVKILVKLPLHVVRKGLEALADAERVQILTSKLNVRGQIFCDANKMANFFKISKTEADALKSHLCTDAWKNYVGDLIKSFGIYEVRDLINNMASLVIQETFGKDTSDQLYSIEKDFQILKNFTDSLVRAKSRAGTVTDWSKLFNVTNDSEFMKIFNERAHLGKQILITSHGALAKEVVKQNTILEYKITPILLDLTTVVEAINAQLRLISKETTENMKKMYPDVVIVMLDTVMDENKTYLALSTPSSDIVCNGSEVAATFLNITSVEDKDELITTLCNASEDIDRGLTNNSIIAKAIASIRKSSHGPLEEVNWTKLINSLKNLYLKLDREYPYLFEYTSYGMNEGQKVHVDNQLVEAKKFWFSTRSIDRLLRLSVKLVFRLLDLVDSPAFNLSIEGWLRSKFYLTAVRGHLNAVHSIISLLSAASRNETYVSALPSATSRALYALAQHSPNLLIDAVDIILSNQSYVEPILSRINSDTPWPCGSSLTDFLPLTPHSEEAVKASETILCMDENFQRQWTDFIKDKNLNFYNTSGWNTTAYEPHLFLKFSGAFDSLVEDISLIRNMVRELLDTRKEKTGVTLADAWSYAADVFEGKDRNMTLRSLLANIDAILTGVSSTTINVSLSEVWTRVGNCSTITGNSCRNSWRDAWKYSLEAASSVLDDIAGELLTYFTEVNEPNVTVLQLLGFTTHTGLYKLYDQLPEFLGTLLNSFWDYGFMTQIRRASSTQFWECEAVVQALVVPVGSSISADTMVAVQPFLCPSLLYWISMPRDANTFLNIIAKPQYTFYNMDVQNLTSRFENAFIKATELSLLLKNISNKNDTVKQDDTSIDTLQNRLKEAVDSVLNYKIIESDPSYRLFNEINKKQFIAATYLTRITAIVNKIAVAIESLSPEDIKTDFSEDEVKKLTSEISTISRIFKRRPHEAIAFHFDVLTDVLSTNSDSFSLVKSLEATCDDIKNNDTSKDILNESQRTKNQICGKEYKFIYGAVENVITDDYDNARNTLLNMINLLRDADDNSTDILTFFKDRKKLINSLRKSVKYAYDLGLPVYLKYLHSNLQSYSVVLSFLSGEDWWRDLRTLYNGPGISEFFDGVESSLDIAVDVLTRLDQIQIVRLLRDIGLNDTASFCQPNVSLSDYIPDGTGVLSRLKLAACSTDKEVFREIPPLLFASQGFDSELTVSKDIDYSSLDSDISQIESRLVNIQSGPKSPLRPQWISEEGVTRVRQAALDLLKGEALTKAAFGILGNIIDASTLFLNSSECSGCSQVTAIVKQVTLQLYKRNEYRALLCATTRPLATNQLALHAALNADFHWDMALTQPNNVPTAAAQAFPMDGIGRLGLDPPRGPSADWWVLTTADAAGLGLTCLPKQGGTRDRNFWSPIQ
ncbi:hypothetical protein evm_011804 [Chilo suppressalis]|nr:hypothetical protein evm_011804 [Chilo suppressalis]